MNYKRHMAIAEATRKNCPRCTYGDYNKNEVLCTTCGKDCPYIPLAMPPEKEIEAAACAIESHFNK